ncbi:hypothetical protein KC717_00025 [Candidatus Dojkabacteria bacterium]|uniref:Uncharacterized protein n=1 Tax=Candidatus Dojkabacteria bacterium TaxID=2099670 RepID=A0A955L6T4_9BACT|nr:hypothetical protein [Candidatus Dojkabacteria bacterium]
MPAKKNSEEQSSPPKKLDRARLHNRGEIDASDDGGSLRAIIILVIIIVAVAVGGAFLVRSIQNSRLNQEQDDTVTDADVTPTPTPEDEELDEPDLSDQILSSDVLPDSEAEFVTEESDYITEDTQFEGDEEATFALSSVVGQPYETFYRLVFTFDSPDSPEIMVPPTDVNYRNISQEVEVSFLNTTEDTSGIEIGQSVVAKNSTFSSLVKSARSTEDVVIYKIQFNESTSYAAQIHENEFILDIFEVDPLSANDTEDLDDDDTTLLEDEDSEDEDQDDVEDEDTSSSSSIGSGSKTEIAGSGDSMGAISGFSFFDSSDKFTYQLKLADENVPKITSSVEEDDDEVVITFVIEDIRFDALPKDGVGYRDFTEGGVTNMSELNIRHAGNKSEYAFSMKEEAEYTIYIDDSKEEFDENRIIIEFMHP